MLAFSIHFKHKIRNFDIMNYFDILIFFIAVNDENVAVNRSVSIYMNCLEM
jgi:hypothetical protein